MFKLTLAFLFIACFVAAEAARVPAPYYRDPIERFYKSYLQRRGCIALGGVGCEANNGKCCREGNPYTGTMRKCVNQGSFSTPKYVCVEA